MPLQITILGLDALGASLGLALGTLKPDELNVGRPVITGWDADRRAISEARGKLAIDHAQNDLVAAVRDADVVFVVVPYTALRDVLEMIGPALKYGAIVTDTAAAKARVLEWATELLPATVEFVGGHPLGGVSGDARDAAHNAFRNLIYCLTPLPRTGRAALDGVEALVRAIGAKPYYIEAVEHDAYVAAVGHLPLALSVALMETLSQSGGWRELQPIAGEALLRMTELAGGSPEAGTEAISSNVSALIGWIDRINSTLIDMRTTLADPVAAQALFERVADARATWLRSEPNLRPGEDAFLGNAADVQNTGIGGLFFGRRPSRDRSKRR